MCSLLLCNNKTSCFYLTISIIDRSKTEIQLQEAAERIQEKRIQHRIQNKTNPKLISWKITHRVRGQFDFAN